MKVVNSLLVISLCVAAVSCALQPMLTMCNKANEIDKSFSLLQANAAQLSSESPVKIDYSPNQNESNATFAVNLRIEAERITKQQSKRKFRVDIQYPRLTSDKGEDARVRRFNATMKKFINENYDWALIDKRDREKEKSAFWHDVEEYLDLRYDISIAHKILLA